MKASCTLPGSSVAMWPPPSKSALFSPHLYSNKFQAKPPYDSLWTGKYVNIRKHCRGQYILDQYYLIGCFVRHASVMEPVSRIFMIRVIQQLRLQSLLGAPFTIPSKQGEQWKPVSLGFWTGPGQPFSDQAFRFWGTKQPMTELVRGIAFEFLLFRL